MSNVKDPDYISELGPENSIHSGQIFAEMLGAVCHPEFFNNTDVEVHLTSSTPHLPFIFPSPSVLTVPLFLSVCRFYLLHFVFISSSRVLMAGIRNLRSTHVLPTLPLSLSAGISSWTLPRGGIECVPSYYSKENTRVQLCGY